MTPRRAKAAPVLVCTLLAVACGETRAAPAPLPRPPAVTAPDLCQRRGGIWGVTWRGTEYYTDFRQGGEVHLTGYAEGSRWVGRWRVKNGVLYVEDCSCRMGRPPAMPSNWSVRLERCREGFRSKDFPPTVTITRPRNKRWTHPEAEERVRRLLRP